MIKNLRQLIALCCTLLVVGACHKPTTLDPSAIEKGHFKIQFTSMVAQTMGFWETDSTKRAGGEMCEKKLNNVSIFVYAQGSDVCIYRRNFSALEIEKNTAIFSLPEGSYEHSKTYDFYAVANVKYVDDKPSRTALLASIQSDLKSYMGLTSTGAASDSLSHFTDIYSSPTAAAIALRNDPITGAGFVMSSAMVPAAVPSDDKPRTVTLPISRLAAKIEVKADTTNLFITNYFEKYGSTLVVDTIKLTNLPSKSLLFANAAQIGATAGDYLTICQIPGLAADKKQYQSVFYCFENNYSTTNAPSLQPELRISATFDFDGDPLTTTDITHIVYRKALALSGAGSLLRNTAYQVEVKINGLTPQEIVTTISVLPWNVVETERIDFGG